MIFTGNETPYQQRQKERTPDANVGTLLLSDAQINKSIADYIAKTAEMQTELNILRRVVNDRKVSEYPSVAVEIVRSILGGVEDADED